MNEERTNRARHRRDESLPEVDLLELARALSDGRRGARYFLDVETGAVVGAFDDADTGASQSLRDSLEYEDRYEPVPTLAATTLNGSRGDAHKLWLMAEALEWLGSVEEDRDLRFHAVGL